MILFFSQTVFYFLFRFIFSNAKIINGHKKKFSHLFFPSTFCLFFFFFFQKEICYFLCKVFHIFFLCRFVFMLCFCIPLSSFCFHSFLLYEDVLKLINMKFKMFLFHIHKVGEHSTCSWTAERNRIKIWRKCAKLFSKITHFYLQNFYFYFSLGILNNNGNVVLGVIIGVFNGKVGIAVKEIGGMQAHGQIVE